MNVNDFKNPENRPEDLMHDIFTKQAELMEKYHPIEHANGLLQTHDCPVNLHDNKGQHRLKDFFWRTTEEAMEALEAYLIGDIVHFQEELADAMHFFVEAMILAGIEPKVEGKCWLRHAFEEALLMIESGEVDQAGVEGDMLNFVYEMGLAANCLKNKPWKQSHMLTDVPKFQSLMADAMWAFVYLCIGAGFTAETLYDMYFRKHQVNKFRQDSNY